MSITPAAGMMVAVDCSDEETNHNGVSPIAPIAPATKSPPPKNNMNKSIKMQIAAMNKDSDEEVDDDVDEDKKPFNRDNFLTTIPPDIEFAEKHGRANLVRDSLEMNADLKNNKLDDDIKAGKVCKCCNEYHDDDLKWEF
jgi:hypothetical protein